MSEAPSWPRLPWPVCAIGLLVPLADLILVAAFGWDYLGSPQRLSLALFSAVLITEFQRQGQRALPTPFQPAPGWLYWVRISVLFGASLFVLIAVGVAVLYVSGQAIPIDPVTPTEIPEAFNRMCVESPLLEEVIYRQAICAALISLTSPRMTILVAGTVFALLHWVYGNPSPENQVGGFLLAWVYLRSGTLAVPILLHAVGNLGVLLLLILAHQFQ